LLAIAAAAYKMSDTSLNFNLLTPRFLFALSESSVMNEYLSLLGILSDISIAVSLEHLNTVKHKGLVRKYYVHYLETLLTIIFQSPARDEQILFFFSALVGSERMSKYGVTRL
tara:strand:- start:1215 stop:1553 length:339 start_codon:yes stop_codon:yes gene_type:complete